MSEKQVLRPEGDQYWKQYDRFIEQLRFELRQLYWLHSFLFAVNSGLLFLFLKESRQGSPFGVLIVLGVVASVLWLVVSNGQRQVRNQWIEKVKFLDEHLDDRYRMWVEGKRKGIAQAMLILPFAFLVIWILLLVVTLLLAL